MWITILVGVASFIAGFLIRSNSVNIGWNNEINQNFSDEDTQILDITVGEHTILRTGQTYYTSNIIYTPTEFYIDHFNSLKTKAIDKEGREISIDKLYRTPEEVPQR